MAVDGLRVEPRHGLFVHAQALGHPDAKVVHHHVRPPEQALDDRARLGGADVESQAALPALAGGDRIGGRPHRLTLGRFDLDHVGSQIGQHLRRERAGDESGEIHHADTRKQRA